jgi:hypothetical protein
VRFLDKEIGAQTEQRFRDHGRAWRADVRRAGQHSTYRYGYPVTVNHAEETVFAANVARDVAEAGAVDDACRR